MERHFAKQKGRHNDALFDKINSRRSAVLVPDRLFRENIQHENRDGEKKDNPR